MLTKQATHAEIEAELDDIGRLLVNLRRRVARARRAGPVPPRRAQAFWDDLADIGARIDVLAEDVFA